MRGRNALRVIGRVAVCAVGTLATLSATAAPPKYRLTVVSEKGWEHVSLRAINEAGQVMGTFDPLGGGEHTFVFTDGAKIDIKPTGEHLVLGSAMNDAGVIVGAADTFPLGRRAFKFENGVFAALEIPELVQTSALDVNESNQILGSGNDVQTGDPRGFLYQNGNVTILPNGPFMDLSPVAVNDLGAVTGAGHGSDSTHPFIYEDGQTTDMGALGRRGAWPSAINDSGQVTGTLQTDENFSGTRAFIRSANGVLKDLGTLGGHQSSAYDINSSGHVVGQADASSGDFHAFLYKSGVMKDLGTLGSSTSFARDITDNGQVVGVAGDGTLATSRVFIYGVDGTQMYDLNDLIAPGQPLEPYVHLRLIPERNAINEYGQIAALGLDNRTNEMRAYLVSPIDSTPPAVRAKLTGTKGMNGWFTTDVGVSWIVTDAEAPVGARIGCAAQVLAEDSAGTEYTCQAISMGGASPVEKVTVRRDSGKPSIKLRSPKNGDVYVRNQVVAADYQCSDPMSGVRLCNGTIPSGDPIDTSQPVVNATFRVVAIDRAGLKRTVTRTYSVE